MWEDPENATGGTFRCEFQPGHCSLYWERLLLDFIGEQLHPDLIGAVVQRKRDSELIVVWNRTSDIPELKIQLATMLFKSLGLPFKTKIVWRKHQADRRQPISTYVYEADGAVLEE
jgi:hypothetical protein